jgi:hypothetical protein
MARRSIIHLLLSLLLLVSQQMAVAHVLTHWNGQLSARGESSSVAEGGLSEAIAKDKSCAQCLAFAQFANVVGPTPRVFAPPATGTDAVVASAAQPVCARTVCVFHSRAPPCAT